MITEEQLRAAEAFYKKFKAQEEAGEIEYHEPTEHQLEQWFFAPGKAEEIDNTRGNATPKGQENSSPRAS